MAAFIACAGQAGEVPSAPPPTPPLAIGFTAYNDYRVGGVAEPALSLNGKWQAALVSAAELLRATNQTAVHWYPVEVPGEAMMQGVPVRPDVAFCYRREMIVPRDFAGCRVLLAFDGVYSEAHVWVNGREAGGHAGGFTPWAVDCTSYVAPGETAQLIVEVVDRSNEVSYASGYAKHPIAGILRNVLLRADPPQRIEDWRMTTTVDATRRHADVTLEFSTVFPSDGELSLQLVDPAGREVPLPEKARRLPAGTGTAAWKFSVDAAELWTAETPRLYALHVTLGASGKTVQSFRAQVGLRQIVVSGEQLLVNGQSVKLRGACRHDLHPLLGRVSTPDYEERDVRLAKEANLNFIRTSHYPPTRHLLELCDRYGLYVEVEAPVCFLETHRAPADKKIPHTGPAFAAQMIEQVRAMERDGRNHASVLFWSVGNESQYDQNIQASYDYLKATDSSRPVIFSYPGTVPDGKRVYDIASVHYPNLSRDGAVKNLGLRSEHWRVPGYPALFDEWAHIACYAKPELKEDPNIRDFWGPSLDLMWRAVLAEPGALGGAVWGMIDETFALPSDLPDGSTWWKVKTPEFAPYDYAGPVVGYGEWGFVDAWRRRKPEFWHVKKAYSPVRLEVRRATQDTSTGDWLIPVENRHDHLNLSALHVRWSQAQRQGDLSLPALAPHSVGALRLPADLVKGSEEMRLQCIAADGSLVDEEALWPAAVAPAPSAAGIADGAGGLRWTETERERLLHGRNFLLRFDRDSGLLRDATVDGTIVLRSGPALTFRALDRSNKRTYAAEFPELARNWKLTQWQQTIERTEAKIQIKGTVADGQPVQFDLTVSATGRLRVAYRAASLAKERLREAGIVFGLGTEFTAMRWERDSYWTAYPMDHPGRPRGTEAMRAAASPVYREEPAGKWWDDDWNFYLQGLDKGSHQLRLRAVAQATREHLRRFALLTADGRERLVLNGDGAIAARIAVSPGEGLTLRLLHYWDYPNLLWGNADEPVLPGDEVHGEVELELAPSGSIPK